MAMMMMNIAPASAQTAMDMDVTESEPDSMLAISQTIITDMPEPAECSLPIEAAGTHDSVINSDAHETADTNRNWWHLLRKGKLDLNDTTVQYPRFLKFCLNVYRWGDHTFNHYDPEYVQPTGKRWKAYVKSDNWVDSYAMNFRTHDMPMRMMSDIYCNFGAYLQYMAVSVGYSLDLSNIIGNKPANHKKLDFSFTCARFSAELRYCHNSGGSYMRTFGDYKNGHLFKMEFPGVNLDSFDVDCYYFFNSSHYSQGAAYSFAKYQVKSSGSLIAGFLYGNQRIGLNFRTLPEALVPYMKIPLEEYNFHYDNYSLLIGYGYNWVFHPNWLINITALPLIGVNHCYEDSSESSMNLFSLGFQARGSITWNIDDFFIGLQGRIDGHWYRSDKYSLFSSIENLSLCTGVRF